MTYAIVYVPSDVPELLEALGTKRKFWYSDSDEGRQRTLYKEGRPESGEHWAEKVCCEICAALEIPHANYELAEWKGRYGVVTQTFVPDGGRLVFGNELLAKMVPDYRHTRRYKAGQHTVRLVMAVTGMKAVKYPLGYAARREGVPNFVFLDFARRG